MDESALLHLKAEACRRLADIEDDLERKALWLNRAEEWEQHATKATKLRPREST